MIGTLDLISDPWRWIGGFVSLALAGLVLWDRRRIGSREDTPWWSPIAWALAVFLIPVSVFVYWGRRRSMLYDRETARHMHAAVHGDA